MKYSADDILESLDKYSQYGAKPYYSRFPAMLGNEDHWYHIAARITTYRDDRRWALILEHFYYQPRAGGPEAAILRLGPFGNCLPDYSRGTDAFLNATTIRPVKYFPAPPKDDATYWEYVPPNAEAIELRSGETIPIPRDRRRYSALGIDAYNDLGLHLPKALRAICATHREKLLATDQDLRQHIPLDLPQFFRLNDWFQPAMFDERPSRVITFRQLATALSTGDTESYTSPGRPTCHWRFWQNVHDFPENDLDCE